MTTFALTVLALAVTGSAETPASGALKPGMSVFVQASTLLLRAKPDRAAAVRAQLAIGTPLSVLGTEGEWARVRWDGAAWPAQVETITFPKGGATVRIPGRSGRAPAASTEGWVGAAYLGAEIPMAFMLDSRAYADVRAGRPSLALAEIERASAADPSSLTTADDWLALAELEGTGEARARRAREQGGLFSLLTLETIELYSGCRGERTRAVAVHSAAGGPRDACLADIDLREPCEACDALGKFDDVPDPEAAEADAKRQFAREQAQYLVDVERWKALLASARTDFPAGPYLVLGFRNARNDPRLAGAKVLLYGVARRFPAQLDPTITFAEGIPEVSVLTLPAVPPQAELILWVKVPEYVGWEYGIVDATDEVAARALVRSFVDKDGAPKRKQTGNALLLPPHWLGARKQPANHGISTPPRVCVCGGC
jgi:hypothetical protein